MCEIDSLSSEARGCFASNKYLAMFLGITQDSLKNLLVLMRKKGLIVTTFDQDGNRELRLAMALETDNIMPKDVIKVKGNGSNKNVTVGNANVQGYEHFDDEGHEHLNAPPGNANVHIDNSIENKEKKTKKNEATASNFRLAPIQETTHVGSTLSEGANLKPPHDSNLEKDARAGVRARAQEAFEKFRVRYQGLKRGHDTELKTLMKHKDWMDVAMSLESALDVAIEQRAAKAAKKEFVPSWPNLQTYLNQRRWEESMQTVEDTGTGFNVSKYKNFQEAREAAQAEFLIDKNQEKRKRNMEIILNWKFPS
jgi:hypothetical protein